MCNTMEKLFDTLKFSSFMSTNGLITMAGWQLIGSQAMEVPVKVGISFVFMTFMGTISKLLTDKFFIKSTKVVEKVDSTV